MRERALGKDGENLLGARLPVAAVDEQQRRRLLARFEKIDPLPGTATPLLRPKSRASRLIARQSSAENNIVMQYLRSAAIPVRSTLPENVLQHHLQPGYENQRRLRSG
jgi:hypothetical protein